MIYLAYLRKGLILIFKIQIENITLVFNAKLSNNVMRASQMIRKLFSFYKINNPYIQNPFIYLRFEKFLENQGSKNQQISQRVFQKISLLLSFNQNKLQSKKRQLLISANKIVFGKIFQLSVTKSIVLKTLKLKSKYLYIS